MSADINEFFRAVKKAALEAVNASAPMSVCYGTVTKVDPLEITVDQKTPLSEAQLILTNNVRDFTVEMTVDHATESVSHGHPVVDTFSGGGSATSVDHSHPYKGKKTFQIHLALKVGEQVLMLRADGGQKFIVLDRLEAPK